MVVGPATGAPERPVAILDCAGVDGAIAEVEKLLVRAEEHHLLDLLCCPRGAAVRRRLRDEVMQEEVKGEDGARKTQDGQGHELEAGETAHTFQDIIKLHGGSSGLHDSRRQIEEEEL